MRPPMSSTRTEGAPIERSALSNCPYQRPQVDDLVSVISRRDAPLVVAVNGPPQTGKTTMILHALERIGLPSRYYAVHGEVGGAPPWLLDEIGEAERREWLIDVWRQAREAAAGNGGRVVVLDDVQHLSAWWAIAREENERDRDAGSPLRVVVVGSGLGSLLTELGESLGSRFAPVEVRHWSYPEMAAAFGFSLDEYLFHGGYPGAARLVGDTRRWRSYVVNSLMAPIVGQDALGMTRIDRPVLLRRLMEMAALCSGEVLSYTWMLAQLQERGSVDTLADYFALLSECGMAAALSKYTGAPRAARGSSPKLNVLSTALMTAPLLRSMDEMRADRTLWGRLAQSAVGAHLHNTGGPGARLHHWRGAGHKVDFVLSSGRAAMGIDVETGPRAGSPGGRKAFRREFPGARTMLVGPRGVPLADFLSRPARHWVDHDGETAEPKGRVVAPAWNRPLVAPRKEHLKPGTFRSRHRQREFMAGARSDLRALARGGGSPKLWVHVARAYLRVATGRFEDDPISALRAATESDEELFAAVLAGLPLFADRADLPSFPDAPGEEMGADGDLYPYAILASLAERERLGRDPLEGLDREGVIRAAGSYYMAPFLDEPLWYRRAAAESPDLCAEALTLAYRHLVRERVKRDKHLLALSEDPVQAETARLAVPRLLRAFPTRCTSEQVSSLHALLWAGFLRLPWSELEDRVRRRCAARGLDAAQRALWLAAGLFISAETYRPHAVKFLAAGREARAEGILNFLVPHRPHLRDLPRPWEEWAADDIAALFEAFTRWYDPWAGTRRPLYEIDTGLLRIDWLLKRWLTILAQHRSRAGRDALRRLLKNPDAYRWYREIEETLERGGQACAEATAEAAPEGG